MGTVNKSMNEDIQEFGVIEVYFNRLRPRPDIQSIYDYDHFWYNLHHYIKAQDYKRNREWYERNGIKQVLILMRRQMHEHLENPIYELPEDVFFKKYHISKDKLLFNKKKWIEKEVINAKEIYEDIPLN